MILDNVDVLYLEHLKVCEYILMHEKQYSMFFSQKTFSSLDY